MQSGQSRRGRCRARLRTRALMGAPAPWWPLLGVLVAFGLPLCGLAFSRGRTPAERWERVQGLAALGAVRQVVAGQGAGQMAVYAVIERWGVFRSEDDGLEWRPVNRLPRGPLGRVDVESLALAPDDPWALVAGLAGQPTASLPAVYKTRDGGRSWVPRRGVDTQGFEALAAAPGSVVYAAGRGHLYRSGDGGDTWLEAGGCPVDGSVLAAAVDPASGVLYLGTRGAGLWLTADRGATWNRALPGRLVYAIAPAQGGRVYAGTEDGLQSSADGGASWRPLPPSAPRGQAVALAVQAGPPDRLYLALAGRPLEYSGDGGATWHALHRPPVWAQVTALALDLRSSRDLFVGTDQGLWHCALPQEDGL